jgi:integrase/recombinase XerD
MLTRIDNPPNVVTIWDLTHAWREYLKLTATGDTVATYKYGWDKFEEWLEPKKITPLEIRPIHLVQFREDLRPKMSSGSVNLILSAVRSFYRLCVESGVLPYGPTSAVKGVRVHGALHRRDALTDNQVLRLLRTVEGDGETVRRDRAILALMLYSGLRLIEIHRADIGDITTRGNRSVLYVWGKARMGKEDMVILTPPVEEALDRWLSVHKRRSTALFTSIQTGQRLSRQAIQVSVTKRMKQAGVYLRGRRTSHSLRHSPITASIRGGASLLQAMAFARHRPPETTMVYIHTAERLSAPAEDLVSYGAE